MPHLCPICEVEDLVLTCEQNTGACQGCQQAAADLGVRVEDLCRECRAGVGSDDGRRVLCSPCREELATCRGEDWPGLDVDEARDERPALRLVS